MRKLKQCYMGRYMLNWWYMEFKWPRWMHRCLSVQGYKCQLKRRTTCLYSCSLWIAFKRDNICILHLCSFTILKIGATTVLHWGLNLLLLWQGWWYKKGIMIHLIHLVYTVPIFVILILPCLLCLKLIGQIGQEGGWIGV